VGLILGGEERPLDFPGIEDRDWMVVIRGERVRVTTGQDGPDGPRATREASVIGEGQSSVIALVLATSHRWRDFRYFLRLRADTPVSPYTAPVSPTIKPVS
jgi:hypothetical protein